MVPDSGFVALCRRFKAALACGRQNLVLPIAVRRAVEGDAFRAAVDVYDSRR
jgi:hypothetical protein